MPLAFINHLGPMEMIVVGGIALLFFGNRLPSVMRSMGKSVTEFKKGISGVDDDIDAQIAADKKKPPTTPEIP